MSYKAANKRTIDYAFKRLMLNEQNAIESGMKEVGKAALAALVEIHKAIDTHVNESNTMAYAVAHDGRIIQAECFEDSNGFETGNAIQEASVLAAKTSGWVVLVYSEMENQWYSWDKEISYQEYTRDRIAADFTRYFKPIAR